MEEQNLDNASEANAQVVPPPAPLFVVHIYEQGKFLRTIDRRFSEEMAEKFAAEYTRANQNCKRRAMVTPEGGKPPASWKAK